MKNAAALTDELSKMFDKMIAKFTDTKSKNRKVVRKVTQDTIDSLHAMKKLQSEPSRQHHRFLPQGKKSLAGRTPPKNSP